MKTMLSWLLAIPYALGWLVGALVLVVVVVCLAVYDGYMAGRQKEPTP